MTRLRKGCIVKYNWKKIQKKKYYIRYFNNEVQIEQKQEKGFIPFSFRNGVIETYEKLKEFYLFETQSQMKLF